MQGMNKTRAWFQEKIGAPMRRRGILLRLSTLRGERV
jgi:hypothetical protein